MVGRPAAAVADVASLLERLVPHPGQERAFDRLLSHYESVGRLEDAVHLAKAGLADAESAGELARRVRNLVRLRVLATRGERGAFARVLAAFEPEVEGAPALGHQVYKAVLLSAIAALKNAPTDTDFQDAADGAWQAVEALKSALLSAGDARRAARLLERAARLPFDRDRRRELLEQAVKLCSDGPSDTKQAIRLYTEIFEEYASHPFEAASVERFAGFLEAAGENGKLARLWDRQAQLRAGADQGACWLRAAAALELALPAAPRDTGLHLEVAGLLESLGEWPRAATVLRQCIATCCEPSSKDRAILYHRLARALRSASDLEGALAQLRVAARLEPANLEILTDLGQVALDAGSLDVAASAYRALLLVLRNPVAPGEAVARSQVILCLSRIALRQGDSQRAASLLDSALEDALDDGEDPDAFERGLADMGLGDRVVGTLALTADPTNRIFVDRLAHLHEEQGDWQAVARLLGRALEAAPGDRPLLLRLVDAHRRAGATAEVLRLLDGAIVGTESDPELLRLRAAAREGAGDDEGAVADLLRLGKDADSVDLVIEMLSRIAERSASPASDTYAVGLVDLLLGAARVEQAQGALDGLLARNPQHAGALERTAALAARRGVWDRAADAYRRLLPIIVRQEPADAGHLAEVGLALADACERAGRPAAAREPLESVLRARPGSAHLTGEGVGANLAWAKLLAKVGRASEALPVLLEVVARNRGKPVPALGAVYLEIARAHLAKDDPTHAGARALLDKVRTRAHPVGAQMR